MKKRPEDDDEEEVNNNQINYIYKYIYLSQEIGEVPNDNFVLPSNFVCPKDDDSSDEEDKKEKPENTRLREAKPKPKDKEKGSKSKAPRNLASTKDNEGIKEEDSKKDILYTKSDTILRDNSNSSANILAVLIKSTPLKNLGEVSTKGDGTTYLKVQIIKSKTYPQETQGWVLKRQISEGEVKGQEQSITPDQKNLVLKEAYGLLNCKTCYSLENSCRKKGFLGIKEKDKLTFDCSSFCSTVLYKVFNIPCCGQYKNKKGSTEEKTFIWGTRSFLSDIGKKKSHFKVIQFINTPGDKININNLQVGDIILGTSEKSHNGINHIMLFVGEGYIIHCTKGYYRDEKTTPFRNGIVKQRLTEDNYYTQLDSKENIASGKFEKRFDKFLYVIRVKTGK